MPPGLGRVMPFRLQLGDDLGERFDEVRVFALTKAVSTHVHRRAEPGGWTDGHAVVVEEVEAGIDSMTLHGSTREAAMASQPRDQQGPRG